MSTVPSDRTFDQVLLDYRRGGLNIEVTQALAEVAQQVAHTGKAGKVTIELELSPNGERMVNMRGSVKTKTPEFDVEVGSFFLGSEGGLHRDDPFGGDKGRVAEAPSAPGRIAGGDGR